MSPELVVTQTESGLGGPERFLIRQQTEESSNFHSSHSSSATMQKRIILIILHNYNLILKVKF